MRFRLGLLVGFATGYYFGAKAGRERYEQLRRLIDRAAPTERVQSIIELAQDHWPVPRGAGHQSVVVPPSPN
jgi:hypothetical protein